MADEAPAIEELNLGQSQPGDIALLLGRGAMWPTAWDPSLTVDDHALLLASRLAVLLGSARGSQLPLEGCHLYLHICQRFLDRWGDVFGGLVVRHEQVVVRQVPRWLVPPLHRP